MNHRKNELIGWAIFMVGFLTAAATSMRKPPLWSVFIPGLILSVIGAMKARKSAALAQADQGDKGEDASGTSLEAKPMLEAMIKELEQIDPNGNPEVIQAGIEHLQEGLIADFVEERRAYLVAHGPIHFAHFFGAFARGERNLNRSWSALIDGHLPEMRSSLQASQKAMEESLELLGEENQEA
jgi:hypothetical protein